MNKCRILWLDNLKGALIFIVVLGHAIVFTENNGESNIVLRYILSFQMPLFMFASGFASYKENPHLSIIYRRFKQCIIPFLSWSIIMCLITCNWHLEKMIKYPIYSAWFLWVLFWINTFIVLTCFLASRVRVNEELMCGLLAIFLIGFSKIIKNSDEFAFNLITFHFIFFAIGYFSRKYFERLKAVPKLLFITGGTLFVFLGYYNYGTFMPFGLPSSMHIIYDIVCGISSFILIVPLFYLFADCKSLIMSSIGGGTLGIYVVHITIFTGLIHYDLLYTDLSGMTYMLYVSFLTLIIFSLSWFICKVIVRVKILSKLLLGK